MKKLEIVAAIIEYDGKILCTQRNAGKFEYVSFKYEFPGGKVEPGESRSEALMRELFEEMDIKTQIKESDFYMTVNHVYPDFEITMHAFRCHVSTPEFVRKEHVDHKWLPLDRLNELDWAPADQPIVKKLMGE